MVTEKGLYFARTKNQYAFEVNPLATKTQIKEAVESLFDVKVDRVMTQTRKGKPRRYRFRFGRTRGYKKAIVKLQPDHRIDFF
jgi:large subunit ribosomal protein L23